MIYQPIPLKRCSKCEQWLPCTIKYFCREMRVRVGLSARCRQCHNKAVDDWASRNQEKHLQDTYRWRSENPDKVRVAQARWVKKNQAKKTAIEQRRRARKLKIGGSYDDTDVIAQHKRQKGKCYWCDCTLPEKYHADHVIPLARGGNNGPENIVITCPNCNQSKGSKLPHEWHGNGGKLL